ncbi:MAG: hypothetical protein JWR06_540, partial [Jatrophihabitans sp.]|nr:hypothetical protein [Jatrophihabitans sp.]
MPEALSEGPGPQSRRTRSSNSERPVIGRS